MSAVASKPKAKVGLDISPTEGGFAVFQPEVDRVHFLNHTAVLVLELCTGKNSTTEIASLIQQAYALSEAPLHNVNEAVATLGELGLLDSN